MAAGGRTEPLANPTRACREVPTHAPSHSLDARRDLPDRRIQRIALGAKPTNSCPSSTSGYFLVDVDGWWDVTVDGFEAEGIPVYESDGVTYTDEFNAFAVGFGLADGAELEAFVRGPQWESIDRNGNGWDA